MKSLYILRFTFYITFISSICIASSPFKGLALWPDEAADNPELSKEISLEFFYALPCDIVKGEDKDGSLRYDWKVFEKQLDEIASRGHQAIVRFRYEYPGERLNGVRGATAVPDFIKKRPDYKETFSKNPDGDGPTWYADWSCSKLENFTLQFYRDFAAKYDNDPRIAYLEAGFGHWSEYHISGTKLKLGKNFPTRDFQTEFLNLMNSIFVETPWLISIDAAEKERSPILEVPELLNLHFGLFDDSFMHKEHDLAQGEGYNEECWSALGKDRWKIAPCGGEISYFSNRDQKDFLNPKGLYGITWEKAACKYHISFMIANDSIKGKFASPKRFHEAADSCGYRLKLVSFSNAGGKTKLSIKNTGVAPLYHDIRPRTDKTQSSSTLKGILPGETREFILSGVIQKERIILDGVKLPQKMTLPFD